MITFGTRVVSSFGDGLTNTDIGQLSVLLAAGDLCYVTFLIRNQSDVQFASGPTWNGQAMTQLANYVDYATDGRHLVYRFIAASSGTHNIVFSFGDGVFRSLSGAVIPVYGANATTPNRTVFHAENVIPWAAPTLDVTDAHAGDVILALGGSIGWNDGYDPMTSTVWTPGASQTSLYDKANSAGSTQGFPRVFGSSKAGADGTVTVSYAASPGQPKWQFVAFAIAPAGPSITSAPTPFRRNSTNDVVTSSLGTRVSATFGTLTCAISGGNIIVPPWAHGIVDDMEIGDNYNLIITDNVAASATVSRPYGLPVGYTHNELGVGIAVDTGPDSLCSDLALVSGSDIYAPDLGGGTLTNDGNLHNVPFGVYPGFWFRDLDMVMWTFTVTLIATALPQKYIVQIDGKFKELKTVVESAGVDDSGKIPSLRGDGTLDPGFIPPSYGIITGEEALPGQVGELRTVSVPSTSAVTLTTTVAANIAAINLDAGEWDIQPVIAYKAGATTTVTSSSAGASDVSATLGILGTYSTQVSISATTVDRIEVCPTVRVRLATSQSIKLVAKATFAVSTLAAYGTIRATRVR